MKKGICWVCIPGEANDLTGRLKLARDAGYDGVELTFEAPGVGPLSLETTEAEAAAIRETANQLGLELPSTMCGAAVSRTPVLHPDPAVRQQAVANLGRALERTRWLGGTTVLLHPGQLKPEARYDEAWVWTRDVLRACIPAVEQTGMSLAIENVWNKFLLTPLEMQRIVDEVDHPAIGAYFDVGNCILFGYAEQWVAILGSRIKKVHVKDFRREGGGGTGRNFCQLLDGDADYPKVMAELRRIGYDDYLTSEVDGRASLDQTIEETAERLDRIMAM